MLAMHFAGLVPAARRSERDEEPAPGRRPVQDHVASPNRRSFVLEKNANYPNIPGIPRATSTRSRSTWSRGHAVASTDVLQQQGRLLRRAAGGRRCCREVRRRRRRSATAARSRTLDLLLLPEHAVPPFDNAQVSVRRSTIAIDKRALQRLVRRAADAGLQLPAAGHAGLPEDRPVPVRRPDAAPDIAKAKQLIQEAGVGGPERHGVGQRRGARGASTRVPRRRAQRDRLQGEAEDRRPATVYFPTIGNRGPKAADGLRGLVPGLPAPVATSCSC